MSVCVCVGEGEREREGEQFHHAMENHVDAEPVQRRNDWRCTRTGGVRLGLEKGQKHVDQRGSRLVHLHMKHMRLDSMERKLV